MLNLKVEIVAAGFWTSRGLGLSIKPGNTEFSSLKFPSFFNYANTIKNNRYYINNLIGFIRIYKHFVTINYFKS